jgi:hypothetical protein
VEWKSEYLGKEEERREKWRRGLSEIEEWLFGERGGEAGQVEERFAEMDFVKDDDGFHLK